MSTEPEFEKLYKRIKSMNLPELREQEKIAITSRSIIGAIAVLFIMATLIFPSVFMFVVSTILVYLLSHISVCMSKSIMVIREHIAKAENT